MGSLKAALQLIFASPIKARVLPLLVVERLVCRMFSRVP